MLDIKTHKIESIKAVRQFCYDTFGVTSGLKGTKDFVETMISDQTDNEILAKIVEWKNLGITQECIERIMPRVFPLRTDY